MCISQESGPHTHSPSPIWKAARAQFHAASNFYGSLTKAHWRYPVGVCLVWLMSETRNSSSSSLPRWDDWEGQALLTDAPERRAAVWTIMAAVRETALPHWGCQNQIHPCGDEASQQGSALCLLGSGLCRAELPQEEKATPSARLSGPFMMWELSSPPEAELRIGSAALVP